MFCQVSHAAPRRNDYQHGQAWSGPPVTKSTSGSRSQRRNIPPRRALGRRWFRINQTRRWLLYSTAAGRREGGGGPTWDLRMCMRASYGLLCTSTSDRKWAPTQRHGRTEQLFHAIQTPRERCPRTAGLESRWPEEN